MNIDIFVTIVAILFLLIFLVYIYLFGIYILNISTKKLFLKNFHNAIYSIYNSKVTIVGFASKNNYVFEQLNLNYEKLCQEYPENKFVSILDVLKTLVHYYDCQSDNSFKKYFGIKKDSEFRDFIMSLCIYIEEENPFISIPQKEANLMQHIYQALKDNNVMSEKNTLKQLSQEIETKEKMMTKMNKDNQITTIISIVGIVLTVVFGFASFI